MGSVLHRETEETRWGVVLVGCGSAHPIYTIPLSLLRGYLATFDKWGDRHPEMFQQHFRFDPSRPWEKHQWRPSADGAWRDCHDTQRDELEVFEFACALDETAAKLSIGMGRPKMMGFNCAVIGYESVGQMFDAYSSSERYHLLGFFDLISESSADSRQLQALRDKDFDTFAALHYGSRQAARYASMIRNLLEAFQKLIPI